MMEGTSKGNYEQQKDFPTSENSRPKRKHSQLASNHNFKKMAGPEMTAFTNYVSPPTATTVSPLLHEPTFTNSFSNNFNYANQFIIPACLPCPITHLPDPHAPPRMCPSLPQADNYKPITSGQINSVQPVELPENPSLHWMTLPTYYANYSKPTLPHYSAKYGKPVIYLSNTVLYPPPDPKFDIKRRYKHPGCRTVYIGGLPEKITEDIVREAFELCGKIETVRMFTKTFCLIRFSCQEEVEQAFILSGYIMKIENKDKGPYCGQLHVDYVVAIKDQHDDQHLALKEEEALEEMNKPRVPPFSEIELQNLLAQFRNNIFEDGIRNLNSWLLKGEVQKRNAGTFFSIIQSLYHNIRRLLSEKERQEMRNTEAMLLHMQRLSEISLQLGEFVKLFKLAAKRKNWDHFSKLQRKNLELWKKLTLEINKVNLEQLVNERVEDEMDVSHEEDSVCENLAKVEEAKLLQKQISEAESGITSLVENISTVRKEKDSSLGALYRNLTSHKKKLKDMQEDYEKLLALQKSTTKTRQNPVSKPVSSSNVEGFLKDACLLTLICQFLIVHPYAVNINYICSHLDKIVSPVSSTAYITNLMRRFPAVFKESISSIGTTLDRKWSLIRLQDNLSVRFQSFNPSV